MGKEYLLWKKWTNTLFYAILIKYYKIGKYLEIIMGFLDKLLSKETRKVISNVVDRVADAAKDAVSDLSSGTTNTSGRSASAGGESDCHGSAAVVENRIFSILAENFSGCELRKQIPASEIGASIAWKYTYGVYRDGYAVAMINILDNSNDYCKKIVLQSKQACADHGIGYVHFLLRLPNRSSYIAEQLKKIIPA